MTRGLITACCLLVMAGCGSVGDSAKDGGGGAGAGGGNAGSGGGSDGAAPDRGGSGGNGGSGGAAGTGQDASGDAIMVGDGSTDGGDAAVPLPVSCQQIKQQNPAAASGMFTIAPLGTTTQNVFCEMTVDNGGWTAFYVGDNGSAPGGAHFETAADACPDPVNRCLRRLPVTIDATHEFAVKCGASVVKFKVPASPPGVLDYFKNGLTHQWQPVTNAVTIDVGFVGKADLVATFWTGDGSANQGWIAAGAQDTTTAFANGYTLNASWNRCNGAPDATSRVMLFYR